MAAKSKLEALARERGISVPILLAQEYEQHGSQKEVANSLGVAPSTIRNALLVNGIEERVVLVYSEFRPAAPGQSVLGGQAS